MKLADFDYQLPQEFIAQEPLTDRSTSKLMVLGNVIEHKKFSDIVNYLQKDDVLVLNDTKVIPARLFGKKKTGGKVEILLIKKKIYSKTKVNEQYLSSRNKRTTSENVRDPMSFAIRNEWHCLVRGKNLDTGTELSFDNNITGTLTRLQNEFTIRFNKSIDNLLDKLGTMPTPPYIKRKFESCHSGFRCAQPRSVLASLGQLSKVLGRKRTLRSSSTGLGHSGVIPSVLLSKLEDKEIYNTVFAKTKGSIAAPTAGLHFTKELLEKIKQKEVNTVYVTLHVGLGTFLPVKEEDITKHKMHEEYFEISKKTADMINHRTAKLFVCGTTTLRCLETMADKEGKIKAGNGTTNLFVYPPYKFKLKFDGMITNFHLPKSTLLMLVSAVAGRERIFEVYTLAMLKKYRFFSFGDVMLIIR